jgi:uroporphyrin-III C-methyltransferase
VAQPVKVYLVGAGPGDPDLLTIRALRVLERADAVVYDRLVTAEVLALANPKATLIYAGKQQGQQEEIQSEIYAWFLRLRRRVATIVRLKGGDPMVFGRGGEELEFLVQHGFDVEVVPGVSSAIAAPALAGIPLTYRGVAASFAVIAGHRQSVMSLDWALYRHVDTLVVLMGVENRSIIAESLIDNGRSPDQSVAFLVNAATGRERVVEATLAEVAFGNADVEPPAVWVIGEVVRLRHRMLARRTEEAPAIP